jgi:hypothetical protein
MWVFVKLALILTNISLLPMYIIGHISYLTAYENYEI